MTQTAAQLTCPLCKHNADEANFYRETANVTNVLRCPASLKKYSGWRKWFAMPDMKQLYACPKCGAAFINPTLEANNATV